MKMLKNRKTLLLLVSAALLLTIAVGSTVAYLVDATDSVVNTFTPAEVEVDVTDEIEDGVKKNVVITNAGDVSAYIRAKVVANWVKDGKIVAPWTDNIIYSNVWIAGSDGFRYYPNSVAAGTVVPDALFNTYTPGTAPVEGASLEMDIIVQAIQAEPTSTVESVWKVTVSNGVITGKN